MQSKFWLGITIKIRLIFMYEVVYIFLYGKFWLVLKIWYLK